MLLKKASFYLNLAPLNKIPPFDNGVAQIFHVLDSKKCQKRAGERKGGPAAGFSLPNMLNQGQAMPAVGKASARRRRIRRPILPTEERMAYSLEAMLL
jgi:hypothetical protein